MSQNTSSTNDEENSKAECPDCGRDSKRCKALQLRDELTEQGFKQSQTASASKELRKRIAKYGEIRRAKTKYQEGDRDTPSRIRYEWWVEPAALEEARREYLPAARGKYGGQRAKIIKRIEVEEQNWLVVARYTAGPTSDAAKAHAEKLSNAAGYVRELLAVAVQRPNAAARRRVVYLNQRQGALRAYNGDGELIGMVNSRKTRTVTGQTTRGTVVMSDGTITWYLKRDGAPIDLSAAHAVEPDKTAQVVTREIIEEEYDGVARLSEINADAIAVADGGTIPVEEYEKCATSRYESTVTADDLAEEYDGRASMRRPQAVTGVLFEEHGKLVL
ncbi:MAG: hypothetical protein ABEI52_03255 [Halobacteriaceae archaeon]